MNRLRSIWLAWGVLLTIDLVGRAGYLAPRLTTLRGFVNYAAAAAVLWIALRFIAVARGRLRLVAYFALVALPITLQWMVFRSYGAFVTPTDFAAFAESPRVVFQAAGEAADRLGSTIVFVLSMGAFWALPRVPKPLGRLRGGVMALVLAGLTVTGSVYWRASATLEHPQPAFACAVAGLAKRAGSSATGEARLHVPHTTKATTARLPNVVLVVGESLAASHLTMYGYDRPTSPRLQRLTDDGTLIPMRDAVVMGPHTRTSVPYIMTGLAGPDPNGRVFRAPTVTEYAKARGYHTAFVSAQEESWGDLDAMLREGADIFKTGISFAATVDVLKGGDDLVVLEQGVLPTLRSLPEPFFLVVHMDGSHLPYRHHSPPSHKFFSEEEGVNSIGAYDNTIRVTDEFLSRLEAALHERDSQAWMFFTSDHGQPLGEGGAFYNHGYQSNVVRDPLFVFPPDSSKSEMRVVADAQTSACDVAPTILHLMDTAPMPGAPMDCADWLAGPPPPRVRVVSAYTPAYLLEPTMLVLLPGGQKEVYDLWRGTVTGDDGVARPMSEHALPSEVKARLP